MQLLGSEDDKFPNTVTGEYSSAIQPPTFLTYHPLTDSRCWPYGKLKWFQDRTIYRLHH